MDTNLTLVSFPVNYIICNRQSEKNSKLEYVRAGKVEK